MKKIFVAFIMGIMSVSCMSIKLPSVLPRDITIPPDPTREVIAINLPFVESWKWTGLAHNFVVISGDRIIISSSTELANQKITVFDAHTGEIIWKSENIKGVDSFQADNQQVYVGTSNYVRAYDIKTGQLFWEE